jgi:hypothetical protein
MVEDSHLKATIRTHLQVLLLGISLLFAVPGYAQYSGGGTSTLTDPLVPTASRSVPYVAASPGAPPAIGSGAIPLPVNPGMLGAPTLLPWVPSIPANQINQNSGFVNLGAGPATLSPPGVLGPSLTVPPPPSTPGSDPGILSSPSTAAQVQVNPGGGLPAGMAPLQRRPGQTTRDFGLTKTIGSVTTDFGKKLTNPNGALQVSQDGPMPSTYPGSQSINHQPYLSNAQMTSDLYGIPMQSPANGAAIQTIAPY